MKTFKEFLTSKTFTERMVKNNHCDKKCVNFITNSLNLQPLIHLMPNKNQVILIMQSKKDNKEILIAFKSHPVCVEFNKYHSTNLLHRIHANDAIAKKLNLQQYTKIRGYVPTSLLKVSHTRLIEQKDIVKEKSNGNFINYAKDSKMHEIFEEIRQIIIHNKQKEKNLISQSVDSKPIDYYIGTYSINKNANKYK